MHLFAVIVIIKFHVKRVIENINPKMIFKQKFKSPWSVGASEAIAASSFYQ